jgi:hypothetical protein
MDNIKVNISIPYDMELWKGAFAALAVYDFKGNKEQFINKYRVINNKTSFSIKYVLEKEN